MKIDVNQSKENSKGVLFRLATARESTDIICFLSKAQVGRGMGRHHGGEKNRSLHGMLCLEAVVIGKCVVRLYRSGVSCNCLGVRIWLFPVGPKLESEVT